MLEFILKQVDTCMLGVEKIVLISIDPYNSLDGVLASFLTVIEVC
jgi:hypothetical protein